MNDRSHAARERAEAARSALTRLRKRRRGAATPEERLELAKEGAREGYLRSAKAHDDAAALDEAVRKFDKAAEHRRQAESDRASADRL